jgi:hypothetical protein
VQANSRGAREKLDRLEKSIDREDPEGQLPTAVFMAQILIGSDQDFENCLEGVSAPEPCCVDGCSDVRLGLRGPHGAIAIGHFPLDHAGPQLSLRAIIGRVDFAGIIAKGQKLVSRAPDFGLQLAR